MTRMPICVCVSLRGKSMVGATVCQSRSESSRLSRENGCEGSYCEPTTRAYESLSLPSGRTVEIPKSLLISHCGAANHRQTVYGHKPVLDFEGRMAFAELA